MPECEIEEAAAAAPAGARATWTAAAFSGRVASVFGALGGGGEQWRVSETVVAASEGGGASSGSDADEGDVGDDDEDAGERWRDTCDAPERVGELPTRAFCNALEFEAEEDEADRYAAEDTWGASGEAPRPPRHTAVLHNNTYERHGATRKRNYTVYALDEPITVGGGGALSVHAEDARDADAAWRVADALVTPRPQSERVLLPAPGSVRFSARPVAKRPHAEHAPVVPPAVVVVVPGADKDATAACGDEEEATPVAPATRRAKRFRRAGADEDE